MDPELSAAYNNKSISSQKSHFSLSTLWNQKNSYFENDHSETTLNNSEIYRFGVFSYYRLDHKHPTLFETKSAYLPKDIYANLPSNKTQVYYYQKKYEGVPRVSFRKYQSLQVNINISTHYSIYDYPQFKNPEHPFDDYLLVGFIKSYYTKKFHRDAIRRSYLHLTKHPEIQKRIKFYFVIGFHPTEPDCVSLLLEEQKKHNDLIILNIQDSYPFLTFKTLITEDFFMSFHPKTPFYLSGDDDVCMDIPKIYSLLNSTIPKNVYFGKKLKGKGDILLYGKHSSSLEALPVQTEFAYGPAYILSTDVLECHIQNIRQLPAFTHVDDAEVGYLSHICGVNVHSVPNWLGNAKPLVNNEVLKKNYPYTIVHTVSTAIQIKRVCTAFAD
ncbi:hypothetical protein WA158_006003 [Blastocystis sp. Blastoise]